MVKGKKLAVTQRGNSKKKKPRGSPFKKKDPVTGEIDPRINTNGRPRVFDELRKMVLDIFGEEIEVTVAKKKVKMPQIESMLRNWVTSQDYSKQAKALEYGFGKVPDESINYNFDIDEFIKQNLDLFTDGQIARLKAGENKAMIVAELMRETIQAKRDGASR